jgi:hypothetical protein
MSYFSAPQSVNQPSIRNSLMRESAFTPQTGTAGGDRAAADFAKGMSFGNAASVGRDMARQNADTFGKRQAQGQQMSQQWGQSQMAKYKQLTQQRTQQSSLAQRLLEDQINMQSDWNVGLVNMGRSGITTRVVG